MVSGENNGYIEVWNADSWGEPKRIQEQRDEISSLRMSPDGTRLASASIDGSLVFLDVDTWSSIKRLNTAVIRRGTLMEFSPTGQTLYTSDRASIRSWNPETGIPLQVIDGFAAGINSLAFSEQGDWIATGNDDGMARLWKADGGGPPQRLPAPEAQVQAVAFDPTGATLFLAGLGRIAVFETATAIAKMPLGDSRNPLSYLSYDRSRGRIAGALGNGYVAIWDALTGKEAMPPFTEDVEGNTGFNANVRYSPDGRWLLTTGLHVLRIRDAETGRTLKSISKAEAFDSAFSPDSASVAFTELFELAIWNIADDRVVKFKTDRPLRNLAYNKDGSILAANVADGRDNTLSLWDAKTGQRLATLTDLPARSSAFAFSPDGKRLVAGSDDGTITVWGIRGN